MRHTGTGNSHDNIQLEDQSSDQQVEFEKDGHYQTGETQNQKFEPSRSPVNLSIDTDQKIDGETEYNQYENVGNKHHKHRKCHKKKSRAQKERNESQKAKLSLLNGRPLLGTDAAAMRASGHGPGDTGNGTIKDVVYDRYKGKDDKWK